MSILMVSADFDRNGSLPRKHTGEGRDVSPALSWNSVPPGTRELALICDDPDAPSPKPWVHWLLYGIPASVSSLGPGEDGGGKSGRNDFGNCRYGGPMPPRGHGVHHYRFTLYALDAPTGLRPGARRDELLAAIKGHVLDEGELVGTYERR